MRVPAVVVGVTAVAAALRFPTLDAQSFWVDEAVTVELVRRDLGGMLEAIPDSESTPPLYYVLAWCWSKLFGTGEAGLRSLSALLGTATAPAAYAATASLVSRRAAVFAGALVAVNPLLVWYSQEARAYALLALLAALSLWLFAGALRDPRARTVGWWALVSALALATHYFAVFLVVPEAVWLLYAVRRRASFGRAWLPPALAVAGVAAAGLALAPLALHQRANERAAFIAEDPLLTRLLQVPKQYLVGFDAPAERLLSVAAGLLILIALWLVARRAEGAARQGAFLAAGLAATAVGLPILLAVAGSDYFLTRNVLAALLPALAAAAAGFAAGRAGGVTAALLCALSIGIVVAVASDRMLQREDWRGAVEALGPATGPRAVVTSASGAAAVRIYAPGARPLPGTDAAVSEIGVIAVARRSPGQRPRPPRPDTLAPPPGFAETGRRLDEVFTVVRFRAPAATRLDAAALLATRLDPEPGAVLLQEP